MNISTKKEVLKETENLLLIHKSLLSMEAMDAIGILGQCQESAIAIGNILENSNCDSDEIVSILEKYCELLYQCSIKDEVIDSGNIEELNAAVIKVTKMIENIKATYRIAFFPYKAEMWDSLESIWMAAKDDENCECDVVPIPYFQFNRELNKWEYAYDGNKFPDYVPVISYEMYKIDELTPDAAYIHYPYDNHNRVTTIHPDYYSDNLKKYVKKLIYVPYYVTSGPISEEHKNFPVYKNMDYYIAQSDYFKSTCSNLFFYDKIVPLGSPKIDKVCRLDKESAFIPDDWKKSIAGKHVLMLNTTLSDLLYWKDKLIKKLRDLFYIVANQNKVAIIWRPHPLLEATIKSMRTEIAQMYDELKEYFISNHIGVLDHTPDLSNIIAISDGYIGSDGSSVINMFAIVGKPVFIINNLFTDKVKECDRSNLRIINAVAVDGSIHFVSDIFSGVFSINTILDNTLFSKNECKKSIQAEYSGDVLDNHRNRWNYPYGYISEENKKIYISSYYSDYISECSVGEDETWNYETYRCIDKKDARALGKMITGEDIAVFLPYEGFNLWKYNISSKQWSVDKTALAWLWKNCDKTESMATGYYAVIYENILWIITGYTNRVLKYNLVSQDFEVVEFGESHRQYSGIVADKDGIWLLDNLTGDVIYWNYNYEYNEIKVFGNNVHIGFRKEINNLGFKYKSLVDMDKYLIAVPQMTNGFVRINKETGEMKVLGTEFLKESDNISNGYDPSFNDSVSMCIKYNGDYIFTQREYDRKAALINVETGEYSEFFVRMSDKTYKEYIEKSDGFEKSSDIDYFARREGWHFSAEAFIEEIGNDSDVLKNVKIRQKSELRTLAANPGMCGVKVHEFVMNELV